MREVAEGKVRVVDQDIAVERRVSWVWLDFILIFTLVSLVRLTRTRLGHACLSLAWFDLVQEV